jgi:21S rRNA (GM2251-2'-O)-methyltransferase
MRAGPAARAAARAARGMGMPPPPPRRPAPAAPAFGAPARDYNSRPGRGPPRDRRPREGGPPASGGVALREGAVPLHGVNPVAAALAAKRRTLHKLYLQEGDGEAPRSGAPAKAAAARRALAAAAAAAGVPVAPASKHDLNMVTSGASHQGVVLECGPLEWGSLRAFPSADDEAAAWAAAAASAPADAPPRSAHPVWLVLDEVGDPRNLGAILRSAFFLGAAGAALAPKNCAPPSPVASKASAGALEWMEVAGVAGPLHAALAAAAAAGWDVVGAAAGPSAEPVRGFRVTGPTLLVLGSEGAGLRPLVAAACGRTVAVAGGGRADPSALGAVDSLNVSVAAAVLLHEMLRP